MINVAMLSKWHVHAKDYAAQAKSNPDINMTLVWDEDPTRGEKWAQELGVAFEPDFEKVLINDSIDAVIVDTPTTMHKEVIIAAAKHKKHIFTEKVLALNVEDCEEIYSVVEDNNVQLTVSLPRLTEDYYLYAQKALDEGLLGHLTTARCRCAHNGAVPSKDHPQGWLPNYFFDSDLTGGGALIDLGAHGIYLSNRLAGPAEAVTARLNTYFKNHQVDDNAAVIVEYKSGALGILETSFVSNGSPFQLELYGTEGTLMIQDNEIKIKSGKLSTSDWVFPTDIPSSDSMPLAQWANAIINGTKQTITKQDFYLLTKINQAASQSARENRRVMMSEID